MALRYDFHPSVLREYDIRGLVGETLTADSARAIGLGFGTIVRGNGGTKVCVGYDGRESSPGFCEAMTEGLNGAGIDVFDIGVGPTPMLYYSVYHLGADGGIMVTGSHNPPQYNGFKMMLGTQPFFGGQIQELGRVSAAGIEEPGGGGVERVDINPSYLDRLLRDLTSGAVAIDPLNIAWDPGNGSAGEVVQRLVKRLPGRHVVINGEIDSSFPSHHPDPTVAENLEQLQATVRDQGMDFGIAFDGDGDRIGAVDGEGRIVWGDQLLAILARDVLEDRPGATVIADVKASRVFFDEVARMGGKPELWRTGHSLIKNRMAETGAPLAGEMSGHIFFADRYYGFDDALYAALRLLAAVSSAGRGLTELYDALPKYVNTPELRFPCPDESKFEIVAKIRDRVKAKYRDVLDIDGVRVTNEHGWWLLRASNTQAVLVARCEADDEAGLTALKAQLVAELDAVGMEPPKF